MTISPRRTSLSPARMPCQPLPARARRRQPRWSPCCGHRKPPHARLRTPRAHETANHGSSSAVPLPRAPHPAAVLPRSACAGESPASPRSPRVARKGETQPPACRPAHCETSVGGKRPARASGRAASARSPRPVGSPPDGWSCDRRAAPASHTPCAPPQRSRIHTRCRRHTPNRRPAGTAMAGGFPVATRRCRRRYPPPMTTRSDPGTWMSPAEVRAPRRSASAACGGRTHRPGDSARAPSERVPPRHHRATRRKSSAHPWRQGRDSG